MLYFHFYPKCKKETLVRNLLNRLDRKCCLVKGLKYMTLFSDGVEPVLMLTDFQLEKLVTGWLGMELYFRLHHGWCENE